MMRSPTQLADYPTQGATADNEPAQADEENQVVNAARDREEMIRVIDELDVPSPAGFDC